MLHLRCFASSLDQIEMYVQEYLPALVQKIETKEFKFKDLEAIVDYYNENCGESVEDKNE